MPDALSIISRYAVRFNNGIANRDKPDFLTRDIGGQWRTNQPYISGYFQLVFGLPQVLFAGPDNAAIASKWLTSTCEGFTPHTQTINKVDIMGQGQIGSSYVTGMITTREFTTTFREFQNLPILTTIKRWNPFDPFTGVSVLQGNQFIPINYKGWCAVMQFKPVKSLNQDLTVDDLEECYVYQGVFPSNIPVDAFSSDITANDTTQLSITWSFDGAPLTSAETGVADKCISLLKDLRYMGIADSTYERYHSHGTNLSPWSSNG